MSPRTACALLLLLWLGMAAGPTAAAARRQAPQSAPAATSPTQAPTAPASQPNAAAPAAATSPAPAATTPAPAPAADVEPVPPGAQVRPGVPFDPVAATRAYLATVPAADRARSDSYFEGGYWVSFWDALITVVLALLLLGLGWSRRMRDQGERWGKRPALATFLYWVQYAIVTGLILLPWTFYRSWVREKMYGLSNLSLGQWFGEQGKAFALNLVLGGLAMVLLYAVVRRAGRSWAGWASATAIVLLIVSIVIAPVFIVPIFNKVTRLTDARIRDPIVQLAAANGVQAHDIYVVDASKQSKRISANVSGFLGTERVTLNDNLLNRATLPEIRAVMAHELGHYVLHHVWQLLIFFSALVTLVFFGVRGAFEWLQGKYGERWGVRGIGDPAGLPLVLALFTIFFYVLGPVTNTGIRLNEDAADIFGLNAARAPDAFANTALKLGEYRKLDPGPLEEILFFDHPSGRARILMSMKWKAEHLNDPLPK